MPPPQALVSHPVTTRTPRVSVRPLVVVILSIAVVACVAGAWALYTFGSLDPSAVPTRFRVFGGVCHLQDDRGPTTCEGRRPGSVLEPAMGTWPMVMPWDSAPTEGDATPTRIWLRVGPDGCREYVLSGVVSLELV